MKASLDPHPICNACRTELRYQQRRLYCSGQKNCEIQRTDEYYYEHSEGFYIFCKNCFERVREPCLDVYSISEEASKLTLIKKNFKQKTYTEHENEATINCANCKLSYHKICVFYFESIWAEKFVCLRCLPEGTNLVLNKYSARLLPRSNLSQFLEYKVNTYLESLGVDFKRVLIRVLCTADHTFKTKERFTKLMALDNKDFPSSFPYRSKAIFAFQEIDGQDICFFGMHCQEYGSDCPEPNRKRVYITYLDSVNYFSPKEYKTKVYQTMILGYLDHVRNLGFEYAHIWSCPPAQGDDYIFYCHPKSQKFPKHQRLIDWYKKLLDIGLLENIIERYVDIQTYLEDIGFNEDGDFKKLPYLDGDFWPNQIEETIEEITKSRRDSEIKTGGDNGSKPDTLSNGCCQNLPPRAAVTARTASRDEPDAASTTKRRKLNDGYESPGYVPSALPMELQSTPPTHTQKSKRSSDKKGSSKKKKSKSISAKPPEAKPLNLKQELLRILNTRIKDNASNFFVIKLSKRKNEDALSQLTPSLTNNNDLATITFDPDLELKCDLFDGRVELLTQCRKHFYEFSSLRTAKYSTAAIVYMVHEKLSKEVLKVSSLLSKHLHTCPNSSECDEKICFTRQFDTTVDNQLITYLSHLQGVTSGKQTYKDYLMGQALFYLLYHSYFYDNTCGSTACAYLQAIYTNDQKLQLLENNVAKVG